jgi:hypothetical protein
MTPERGYDRSIETVGHKPLVAGYGASMDWLAPINTLVGAGIGVGSTLLADRVRWRRDRARQREEARHHAYAAFMGALGDLYQSLHDLARDDGTLSGPRAAAAHEAFRATNLYPLRYQLVLIAPWDVVESSNAAFWRIRDVRDLVAGGANVVAEDYRRGTREYLAAAEKAQDAMRRDLGTSWQRPPTGSGN